MLRENLDELQQTVSLMGSDNHDEFFDISIRNKKYGRVDALNGPMLLEKYVLGTPSRIVRLLITKSGLPLYHRLLAEQRRYQTCHPGLA
jgi:hypothetical protein